jgi:putative DNA-invertase from lambdoid prophage Rac
MVQKAVIYTRVSTDDQSCERQIRDLKAFADRAGYTVTDVFKETASGMKNDRKARAEVMNLAQARKIDAVLVTELTRWGRSIQDLLQTLNDLAAYKVSVIAQTGFQFDLSTAQGKLMAGIMASLAEFERNLLTERVKSGLAAARSNGVRLGRQEGFNPSDKYAAAVIKHINAGRSYRWIANDMQISKTTVVNLAKRHASKITKAS